MSIKDKISELDSVNDNLVEVPISVIVLDENDNAPIFQNVSIQTQFPLMEHFKCDNFINLCGKIKTIDLFPFFPVQFCLFFF